MQPLHTAALAALFVAWAASPAPAQESAPAPKAKTTTSQDTCRVHVHRHAGARLGIQVSVEPNPETDSIGALVHDVTEDGPADRAGIRKGDIITRFNTERLAADGAADRRSRPGRKLVALARELEPGDTVRLEYRRDGRVTTQTLVAERAPSFSFRMPHVEGLEGFGMDFHMPDLDHLRDLHRHIEVALPFRHRLHGLELVDLNPELGAYFGATEGILVVDVRDESSLGLEPGDVILTIGGRTPGSPGQALRIITSYEPEETIRFDILRQKKRQTIEGKVPERAFEGRRLLEPRDES